MPRAGIVLHNRWNPEDVMGCIDVLHQAGVDTTNMSLARVIGLALKSYLQASRNSGQIPTRDGFEYSQMIAPFQNTTLSLKVKTSESLHKTEIDRVVNDLPAVGFSTPVLRQPEESISEALQQYDKRIIAKIAQLSVKRKADPDNFDSDEQDMLAELSTFHDAIWNGTFSEIDQQRCNELLHK